MLKYIIYDIFRKAGESVELFDIAGLKVEMECRDGMLYKRSRAYLAADQSAKADFTLCMPEEEIVRRKEQLPNLTLDETHYVYMGEGFYRKLLGFDGFLLHSSCIEKDGEAYLFSAKSGTGKSTHTHLWMETLEGVHMINDDKPALRKIDGKIYACGTPFSGKNDESSNMLVPVKAIVFIERAKENRIEKIESAKAIPLFLSQTVRPSSEEYMTKLLGLLDSVLTTIPVFKLYCNISAEAVYTAYEGINNYYIKEKENED